MKQQNKQQNFPSAEIEKIADEIYTYFKENNARMTELDAIRLFEQYSMEDIVEAFAIAVCFRGMQETGVYEDEDNGEFTIYGYSKDGASLEGEGYWVRGPMRINKKGFARIPTQMFKGFLISQPHRKEIIDQMLDFAIYDRSLYCGSAKEACEFLKITADNPDACAKTGKEISQTIRTHSYYFLELSKLFNIRDNNQCSNEQAALFLIYYALGSIKGNREWQKTNNKFLLSRMDGNDSPVSPEEWSDEIKAISTRAKLDRLKRLVSKYYNVAFFGARTRGFYFAMKYNENQLMALVAASKLEKANLVSSSKKKEKTQAQKYEEIRKYVESNHQSVDDVKKSILDSKLNAQKEEDERKRNEAYEEKYG